MEPLSVQPQHESRELREQSGPEKGITLIRTLFITAPVVVGMALYLWWVPILVKLAGSDHAEIRSWSLRLLVKVGPPAVPHMLRLLSEEELMRLIPARHKARGLHGVWAVGPRYSTGLGIPTVGLPTVAEVPGLVSCLSDPRPKVRLAAAELLRDMRGDRTAALPALEKALADEDSKVRNTAYFAIRRVNGIMIDEY